MNHRPNHGSLGHFGLASVLYCFTVATAHADETIDFNRDIRSLLSNHCVACHGPDKEARASDLRLDTQEGSRIDLGGYAAIVPGNPDTSELLSRLTTDDEDMRMPPAGKGKRLSDQEISVIRRWIKQGAQYDRHWSYQIPSRPTLPLVEHASWPRNAIDHFVLAKLEAHQLKPSPAADRWTLAKRLAMDLTGLPPTWQQAQTFVNDRRPNAYSIYVDSLLEHPTFGERWARVWLDLARYADSAGYADDPPRVIWAFRDYVIDSLNENKPFDRFTVEQIAGDLLDDPSEEQLVATAFHRNTLTNNEGGTNDEEFRNVAIVDRVNTTMAVWMGTTMACAQCHTHKYDPITQEEYFRFFAFFNNSQDADRKDESPVISLWSDQQIQRRRQLENQIEALQQKLDTPTPQLQQQQTVWLDGFKRKPTWETFIPTKIETGDRTLTSDERGWIHSEGPTPNNATDTIEFIVDDVSVAAIQLEVGEKQTTNFVLSQVKATWIPHNDQSAPARYVRIELPGNKKILHLAEVEVFRNGVNVALQGKATQSSTGYNAPASRGNDGNTSGDFADNSVTHNQTERDPWWEIDLLKSQDIDRVVVWNRTDGGADIGKRLTGYRVIVLDDQRHVLWQQQPEQIPEPQADFAIDGTRDLEFENAFADYEQAGFPASTTITDKPDPKQGWAIAGQLGRRHSLTLPLKTPLEVQQGILRVTLRQSSIHLQHLLTHFRIRIGEDERLIQWAKLPANIRQIIQQTAPLNPRQANQLSAYYRSIAPDLKPARDELAKRQKQLAELKPQTTVPVMRDLPKEKRRVTKIQLRGNYLQTGDEVEPGVPAALHPLPIQSADGAPPDRLTLARWLVDEANPLTARVIANRHWEEIFGTGIVESSEEFGAQGDRPSHPELLDWLAVELRENGWDLKALLRLIVHSATYQQSGKATAELLEADPANRLLSRGARFRISAEMVRDQALFVSGLLSDKMLGPPVKPPQPNLGLRAAFGGATDWKTSESEDRYRRGLYTTWRRSNPYPSMATFDAPNREVCTIRRGRTNTPLQALVTLNDPVYIEAAQGLARRMLSAASTPADQIRYGVRVCLIREPSDEEMKRLVLLYEQAREEFASTPEQAKAMAENPRGPLAVDADAAHAAALTVVGNVILNLDEMFMKR